MAALQACASATTLSEQESKGMESHWTREVEDGVTCSRLLQLACACAQSRQIVPSNLAILEVHLAGG